MALASSAVQRGYIPTTCAIYRKGTRASCRSEFKRDERRRIKKKKDHPLLLAPRGAQRNGERHARGMKKEEAPGSSIYSVWRSLAARATMALCMSVARSFGLYMCVRCVCGRELIIGSSSVLQARFSLMETFTLVSFFSVW